MELPLGRSWRGIGDGRLSRCDGCELDDDEGFGTLTIGFAFCTGVTWRTRPSLSFTYCGVSPFGAERNVDAPFFW